VASMGKTQDTRKANPRFRGAFTAIITPFTPDGSKIDFDRLHKQINDQARGGVTGIVVSGTTGESPTLDEREFHHLVEKGIEYGKAAGLMVLVGTGSNNTHHSVQLQKFAAKAGADAALSVNPYYNKPTQDGMIAHFTAIADAADLSIMLYNIPGRTGVALTTQTIQRLAQHPNIQALKDATGNVDHTSDVCMHCPSLAVLSGDDPLTLPMASVGAVGVVSVLSNVLPSRISALCEAFLSDRWSDARMIHRELAAVCKALFLETNPIPVKAAMKLLGRDTGVLRLPMTGASDATIERLRQVLTTHELL
jgi:4-hydroxy-tetrahydrodipicolinate synthase